jgi:hypothetical protein
MKTAEEHLNKAITGEWNGDWSVRDCVLGQSEAIRAMETYATQQTADLNTQLAKANEHKEKAVALVKEMQQYIDLLFNEAILDDFSDIGRKGSNLYDQAHNLLTDCGITL